MLLAGKATDNYWRLSYTSLVVTSLVILSSIVVFFIAIFSPLKGTAIQRKSLRLLKLTRRISRTKPRAIRWLIDIPTNISHFMLHHSAALGKLSRWKLPF